MAHQPNPVFSTPATAQQQQLRLALFNFSIFLFGLLLYILFVYIPDEKAPERERI
jgi:hypothetical protein